MNTGIGCKFRENNRTHPAVDFDIMSVEEFEANIVRKEEPTSPKTYIEECLFPKEEIEEEKVTKIEARNAYDFFYGFFDNHLTFFNKVYTSLCEDVAQEIIRYSLPGGLRKIGSMGEDSLLCYANIGRLSTIYDVNEDCELKEDNDDGDSPLKEIKKFPRVATLNNLHEVDEPLELDITADTLIRKPSRALSILEEIDEDDYIPSDSMPTMELRRGASKNLY